MSLRKVSDIGNKWTLATKVSQIFILIVLAVLIATLPKTTFAQEAQIDFKTVDATTYQLYMQQDWDSLIEIGNSAIKSGQDYFYLRLRLGIAYYYIENYRKAANHLQKANQLNNTDATAQEFLYYSYLFSKRDLEAVTLLSNFPERLREKINTKKHKILDQVYIETGPTFSDNIDKNTKGNLIGQDSVYGEQDLNDDKYYFQVGLRLNPWKRISMYAGYSYLRISKLKRIQATEVNESGTDLFPWQGGWIVGKTYDEKATEIYEDEYKLIQNQGYLNANIFLGKGFILTPAFHFLYVKYNTIKLNSELTEFPHYPGDPFPEIRPTYTLDNLDTSYYNYVASLAINKDICLFNFGIFGTYSNLNNKNQYQAGASISFYPKGNLDVYSITNFISAWEDGDNRLAFEELIGVKAMKKLWIEGSVLFGEMINHNEKNAYVVYNSGDKMKLRAGMNIIVPLSEKFEISLRYQYFINEGSWFNWDENYNPQPYKSEYQNHTIIGGFAWKL